LPLISDVQVEYFKKRRVMEHQRAETLARIQKEDAKPLPLGAQDAAGTSGIGLGGK
jgi:hypothetical protein